MPINTGHLGRKFKIAGAATLGAAALVVGIAAPGVAAPTSASAATVSAQAAKSHTAKPTIILVHGAWADASSFAPVTKILQHEGYTVRNAPVPLRGLASDAASLEAYVTQAISGPVVLVGHSYGGAVITQAAASIPKVKALVYIDAYAPSTGESVVTITGARPGSALAVKDPSTVFDFVQYPGAPTGDVDTYIKPGLFKTFFGSHLATSEARELAASQSPVTLGAISAPLVGAPAWKSIKSYFFVGTTDKIIPQAEQVAMAKRAGGVIVKGAADHLSMLEQPAAIAKLITKASK